MTAQAGDRIVWNGVQYRLLGALPLHDGPWLLPSGDDSVSTSCWRGYVATWAIRGEMLFLSDVEGRYRLASTEDVFAEWITGWLRLVDASAMPLEYLHMGYESLYASAIELQVVDGRIKRWRCVSDPRAELVYLPGSRRSESWTPIGISGSSPIWELVEDAGDLFSRPATEEIARGEPEPTAFVDRSLRARVTALRGAAHLKFGQLVDAAGGRGQKHGAKLAEWERGLTTRRIPGFEAVLAYLGITKEEEAHLAALDETDFKALWDAWANEPVTPTLTVNARNCLEEEYWPPERVGTDSAAVEAWAAECARAAWRSVELRPNRRMVITFDENGVLV